MRGVPRPQIPVLMDDELSSESDSDVEPETQTCEFTLKQQSSHEYIHAPVLDDHYQSILQVAWEWPSALAEALCFLVLLLSSSFSVLCSI